MRTVLALCFMAAACGGPSSQQLAETPSATNPPRRVEAPAASTSDRDREMAVQQFDDMETTQRAHREAGQSQTSSRGKAVPATTSAGTSAAGTPAAAKKTGPAEQATLPKKTGPAEQAP